MSEIPPSSALDSQDIPFDEERERIVLKDRARKLARTRPAEPDPDSQLDLVEFQIGNERYGLALSEIREVGGLRDLTPIPTAPPALLGIINLRGELHAVIDLRKLLDLPGTALSDLSKVLILVSEDSRAAVLADRILGVRSVAREELQAAAPAGLRDEYLRGVTSDRLIVLSAAKILASPAISLHEE